MRKRDRLLPKSFRTKPTTSQSSATAINPLSPPPASSVQDSQVSAPVTSTSRNPALELAIQRHLDKIPAAEKAVFRDASKAINDANLLSRVRAYDEAHIESSSFRPQAERLSKFLKFLNRFMGGVAIGIQASPEISSLVVGAVRIIIDLAMDFVTFYGRLTDMLCQFEGYLASLEEYSKASKDFALVQENVADIYGDLLDFCQKARHVFVNPKGDNRKLASIRLFIRQQWEPFETEFACISKNMEHHRDVLLHSAQALQLSDNREAKQERHSKST